MHHGRRLLAAGIAWLTLTAGGVAEARRPPVIYDMVLGQPAPPPIGYVNFCVREPTDCFTSEQIAAARTQEAAHPAAETQAAIASEPAVERAAAPLKPNYWSFAFRSAEAQRRVAYRGREPLAGPPASIHRASIFSFHALPTRRLFASFTSFPPAIDDEGRIALTRDVRSTLNRINRDVNRRVISVSDQVNYGQLDVWGLPLSRNARHWGDCEDYAVEKRHQLLQAGFPMNLLSLALVRTRWGDTHAVLLVETNEGALALDSFTGWITPWWKLDYQWIMRQSTRDPTVWLPVLGEGWFGTELQTPG